MQPSRVSSPWPFDDADTILWSVHEPRPEPRRGTARGLNRMPMNFAKTGLLLAVLTGIFVAMGAVIGGQTGMVIAFVIAAGHEHVQPVAVRQDGAAHVRRRGGRCALSGGEYYRIVQELARRAGAADAARLRDEQPAAQCVRDRTQPGARRRVRVDRPAGDADPRGGVGRDGARAGARQELRHADHGGRGHHRRRHLDARAVPAVRRAVRRQPREQPRLGWIGTLVADHRGAAGGHAGADGDQPLARVPGRPHGRA